MKRQRNTTQVKEHTRNQKPKKKKKDEEEIDNKKENTE